MTIGLRSEIARSTEDVIPGPGTTISKKRWTFMHSGTSKVSWLLAFIWIMQSEIRRFFTGCSLKKTSSVPFHIFMRRNKINIRIFEIAGRLHYFHIVQITVITENNSKNWLQVTNVQDKFILNYEHQFSLNWTINLNLLTLNLWFGSSFAQKLLTKVKITFRYVWMLG